MYENYVIHKTGSTQHIATPPEEDQTTAIGNMHKNLAKFGRVVVEICKRTDGQTDKHIYKQTDILIRIVRTSPGGGWLDNDQYLTYWICKMLPLYIPKSKGENYGIYRCWRVNCKWKLDVIITEE